MTPRPRRRAIRAVLAAVLVLAGLTLVLPALSSSSSSDPSLTPAADLSQFNPANIITDEVFFAGEAMSATEIDAFIAVKGRACVAGKDGTPCLKDFRMDTGNRSADKYCNGYAANKGETAGAIIAQTARACGVSPRVLLVLLQKEQGLLTISGSSLYASRYQKATGFACPDTAPCDTAYYGFQNQVYAAARQYKFYAANPTRYAYQVGRPVNVLYNPNSACGSSSLTIANQATAGLYIYTPYQPNGPALAAGYGKGDACSAYGNRNFWLYFTDWFGSTQYDAVAATLPKGSVDAVTSSYGQISVAGWALDPDAPDQSLQVHVYVDGRPVLGTGAALYRGDVAAAYGGAGPLHGYAASFPYALGVHQVCVYAINIGAGKVNPQLGCAMVDNQDAGAPVGSLDAVSSSAPNVIDVAGWAVDQDSTTATVPVHVYVDGQFATQLPANAPRPDVGLARGVGPDHGFSGRFPATRGTHTVCVYAINVGLGVTNVGLGCSKIAVRSSEDYEPRSSLDSVTATGGTVSLSGWAFDPDVPGSPVALHVYVDGTFAAQVGTGLPRGDVGQVYPDAGPAAGFHWQGVVPAGVHQVCVFAINTGYGNVNPLAGCRQVSTVGGVAADPFGSLDLVSGGYGTVSVAGWAYDVDEPAAPVAVHVYSDGQFLQAFPAASSRPDVAAVLGARAGAFHGFGWTGALPPGEHDVCAYAINIGAGTGNPQLGCRTVTVTDPAVAHDPRGSLDAVTVTGTTIALAGWALDPDLGQAPAAVHVYADGAFLTAFAAGDWRADVGALFPESGSAHGFNWQGTLTSGRHTVCAFAINAGQGTGTNPLLGCRTVDVG